MLHDIEKLLAGNPYPGRGIIMGISEDGTRQLSVYFIMGRSENSRNRVFEKTEDGIRTAAYDMSKMTDPSLIIYHPVRVYKDCIIVTNGDQTDTIRDYRMKDGSFFEALNTRTFEPDSPNYTPRISGIQYPCGGYTLSILKAIECDNSCCERAYFTYSGVKPGLGHFISTYETDGDPLPSFDRKPIPIEISDTVNLETFAMRIWNALSKENKVSLYACNRNIKTGEIEEHIINKHRS